MTLETDWEYGSGTAKYICLMSATGSDFLLVVLFLFSSQSWSGFYAILSLAHPIRFYCGVSMTSVFLPFCFFLVISSKVSLVTIICPGTGVNSSNWYASSFFAGLRTGEAWICLLEGSCSVLRMFSGLEELTMFSRDGYSCTCLSDNLPMLCCRLNFLIIGMSRFCLVY